MPNLHFELCYYQGIEFCLSRKLAVFEAGAQGEHKIARDLKPIKTCSAHKFKNINFQMTIENYIENERMPLDQILPLLNRALPFR